MTVSGSVFTPGVATDATSGLHFVISKNASLCVIRDGDTLGLPRGPAADAIYLGDLDGIPCFARWLGDDPIPAGAEVVPLRQLFGSLTDEQFGIAGRALGLTSWDR